MGFNSSFKGLIYRVIKSILMPTCITNYTYVIFFLDVTTVSSARFSKTSLHFYNPTWYCNPNNNVLYVTERTYKTYQSGINTSKQWLLHVTAFCPKKGIYEFGVILKINSINCSATVM